MSANNSFDPEKIIILECKMTKGQVDTPAEFDVHHIKSYQLDNSLQLGFNLEEKLAKAELSIAIKTQSEPVNFTSKEATGTFHFVFIYRIDNLQEFISTDKHTMNVHPVLGNALSSITYSTARGILLVRLQGTALQNFILPVINPNSLLHNNES